MSKKAIIVHSGGMDSSICLALAVKEFGKERILSLSFSYNQRHSNELKQAKKICTQFGVDHRVISVDCIEKLTKSALIDRSMKIEHKKGNPPNSIVVGRNGLMARLAAIYAHNINVHLIYMGVIEIEEANSGYRDCSRHYMDLMEEILRIDLDDPLFEIRTPLVKMVKRETLELANELGVLEYLIEETISCYEGIPNRGCGVCPACLLRNQGIDEYYQLKKR